MNQRETALTRFEKNTGLAFKEAIHKLHFEEKRSILWLSKLAETSRDFIYKEAARNGLMLATSSESGRNKKLYFKHPNLGKTKDNSAWARRTSERMVTNNPTKNENIRIRMSKTMSEHFKRNLYPQELKFKNLLESLSVEFEIQKPIGTYIVDFFIPSIDLCIEIDSTSKWGIEQRERARIKDEYLRSVNKNILRINKNKLSDNEFIINLLKTNNVI